MRRPWRRCADRPGGLTPAAWGFRAFPACLLNLLDSWRLFPWRGPGGTPKGALGPKGRLFTLALNGGSVCFDPRRKLAAIKKEAPAPYHAPLGPNSLKGASRPGSAPPGVRDQVRGSTRQGFQQSFVFRCRGYRPRTLLSVCSRAASTLFLQLPSLFPPLPFHSLPFLPPSPPIRFDAKVALTAGTTSRLAPGVWPPPSDKHTQSHVAWSDVQQGLGTGYAKLQEHLEVKYKQTNDFVADSGKPPVKGLDLRRAYAMRTGLYDKEGPQAMPSSALDRTGVPRTLSVALCSGW